MRDLDWGDVLADAELARERQEWQELPLRTRWHAAYSEVRLEAAYDAQHGLGVQPQSELVLRANDLVASSWTPMG